MAQKIIIVGAGIIGASLAFHLSRAGAEVTVFEATQPASAATGRSFGWINASFYANPAHHRLRAAPVEARPPPAGPPAASAATGRSFGWINASFYANPAHHRLRAASMQAWHRQSALLPEAAPNWQGCLWWE